MPSYNPMTKTPRSVTLTPSIALNLSRRARRLGQGRRRRIRSLARDVMRSTSATRSSRCIRRPRRGLISASVDRFVTSMLIRNPRSLLIFPHQGFRNRGKSISHESVVSPHAYVGCGTLGMKTPGRLPSTPTVTRNTNPVCSTMGRSTAPRKKRLKPQRSISKIKQSTGGKPARAFNMGMV